MRKFWKILLGILAFPLFLFIGIGVGLFEMYCIYDESFDTYDGDNYDEIY